ncbi:TPA: type VI secretion system contractile sheath large subunit [Pseudomonas aeruginosa]|nr:type VI secretion system contractile sheath large subunit [Pseudomonas aeruginosa]
MAELSTENLAQGQTTTEQTSEFASLLLQEFKPKTERAREAVETAVRTLAEHALEQTSLISNDAIKSIESIIAAIDAKLTAQVNLIMHHADFQQLESAWRGLHYLVNNTETDEQLKIRVLNISKPELHKTLKKFKGTTWDQSPIFKKLYEEEYGQFGGEPYGCLVGDYYFDQSPPDVELLGEMAKISAAMHAPFISAASPTVMGMGSWQELSNPRDLTKIFTTPEYAGWRSLRESEDSRYIGLTMPRFLARLPYLFATCRFAHYLKCIVRDKIGSFKEKDEMQRWLQDWILNYVDGDPAHSTETTKAQHPLAAAEVVVEEVEGNPGYYNSKFFLRPHYQLEGLTVSLRLVSKLPSAKEA